MGGNEKPVVQYSWDCMFPITHIGFAAYDDSTIDFNINESEKIVKDVRNTQFKLTFFSK